MRFPDTPGLKVPHMGWNCLDIRPDAKAFKGLASGEYVYFVHSYYLKAEKEEDVAASSVYGVRFTPPWSTATYLPASSIRKRAVLLD